MDKVMITTVPLKGGVMAIFRYSGAGDPVVALDRCVEQYTQGYGNRCCVMVDAMDLWTRVVITNLDLVAEGCEDLTPDIIRQWRIRHLLSE
jgi:accessory colonization factor AcfC